jgi:hypothetical protein
MVFRSSATGLFKRKKSFLICDRGVIGLFQMLFLMGGAAAILGILPSCRFIDA